MVDTHRTWWAGLEFQWRQAFQECFFNRPDDGTVPNDQELEELRGAGVLRCAGPTAPYPNLSIALTNLSGVRELQKLTFLSVTDSHITGLEELAGHTDLVNLFVNDNRLTSIAGIENCRQLEGLYLQNNRVASLEPLRSLRNLKTVYVSNNALASLEGLTSEHGDSIRDFYVLPNEALKNRDLIRLQNEIGLLPKKG